METLTDAKIQQVLQPLSVATERLLSPVKVNENVRLLLSLDSEGRKFIARLCTVDFYGKESSTGIDYRAFDFMGRFPEKQAHSKRIPKHAFSSTTWTLAGTDYTALIIHYCWPAKQLIFSDKLDGEVDDGAKTLYEYLLNRFLLQSKRATLVADFKINGIVPEPPRDWLEKSDLPLTDYQKVGVLSSLGQSASALFLDRGVGKTPVVITRVCMEAIRRPVKERLYKALIVCPPQVRQNWLSEFGRFATTRGKCTVIKGTVENRFKLLIQGIRNEPNLDFAVIIIGYDSLVSSFEHFNTVPWDIVVLDESHFIKSSATKRWKVLKELREHTRARMCLTGTPIGNSPMDLWTQLEFLDDGLSGFQSEGQFKSNYGKWEEVGGPAGGVAKLVGLKNIPLLQERLARITYSLTKAEAKLKLPEKVYNIYEVEMTPKQQEIYNKVLDELRVEFEDRKTGEMSDFETEHVLKRLLRLAEITSGFLVIDKKVDPDTGIVLRDRAVHQISEENPKINAIIDMLTEEDRDPLGKTIIWCNWVEDIRVVSEALKKHNIKHGTYYGATSEDERERIVQAYNNDPTFKVFVANPQTAGEGLNLVGYDWNNPAGPQLQTNTDRMIFMSQNWSAILRGQAEDRAHRKNSRVSVQITDLVVLETIDEEIRLRVADKQIMAKQTFDLRNVLHNVLQLK